MGLFNNRFHSLPFHTFETDLQRIINALDKSLAELHYYADDDKLEDLGVFIIECMASTSRNYHGVEHILDIWEGSSDPILILSGLFHDIVYYHIDGQVSPLQMKYLYSLFDEDALADKRHVLLPIDREKDPLLSLVAAIFNFSSEDILSPFGGANEFFSAVITARLLHEMVGVSYQDLAAIAVCIEATVPFRKRDERGNGPMEWLYERLSSANGEYGLEMDEAGIVEAVQRAAELSNRDVTSFSYKEEARFLDMTWKLIPESNGTLRQRHLYTISEYGNALKKMLKFFCFLDHDNVFRSFQGYPNKEVMSDMTNSAARNIEIARLYLRAKIASISVLSAFAQLTGGDAPLSLFVARLPGADRQNGALDPYLPRPVKKDGVVLHDGVFNLLTIGRETKCDFDILNSPLGAYIYGEIGDEGTAAILKHAERPMDDACANKILEELPPDVLTCTLDAVSMTAITRARKLRNIRVKRIRHVNGMAA
eukprot:CAMPEP_0172502550 /NCGR_PEP_ID=MMETSP1066-20121228/160977_1 /TAXON_ID=671091 /ORGANISM="Coscinodiscus wailesii, Strain CCMP2513" /LENGTH=481 /DNA_ID=CAMNT_0013277849 /DNA_START=78 /DNA_END=1523 /DNA_ORIENTATION=+